MYEEKNIKKNLNTNQNVSKNINFEKSEKNSFYKISPYYFYIISASIILSIKTVRLIFIRSIENILKANKNYPMLPLAIYFIFLYFILQKILNKHPQVYLREFSVFQGEKQMQIRHEQFLKMSEKLGMEKESIEFLERVFNKSGIGHKTLFNPEDMLNYPNVTIDKGVNRGLKETRFVIFSVVEDVLKKSNLDSKQIDFVIINCSLFCPTPSLAANIVNHFKMKESVKSFNIGGMGCSANVISVDLAKDLLRVHKNSYALVVSTENIGNNWYTGKEKSMLISNTLFRVGGAAMILTNKKSSKNRLELIHTVLINRGADDKSFKSIQHIEDDDGVKGVRLSMNLVKVAGVALKKNIAKLGPLVLPLSEQFQYALNKIALHFLRPNTKIKIAKKTRNWLLDNKKSYLKEFIKNIFTLDPDGTSLGKSYVPDFTNAFDHFCIHAGGKKVIETIGLNLKLSDEKLLASRSTLQKWGNTSSSSIWYEMEFHMKNSGVKKGDIIWQIAFGSGFKCNSSVWKSLKKV